MKVIAVIQFPGSNCETETVRALQRVGLSAEVFRWNRPSEELETFSGYIVPGGFSYEDRVRAGVIAAKEPLLDRLALEAERGKPILGICNGAQILLEAGLLPGLKPGRVEMALAHNYMTRNGKSVRRGHHCGWLNARCEVQTNRTPFTLCMEAGEIIPMTVSHGEGRFTTSDPHLLESLRRGDQIVWRYCSDSGELSPELPINPNGSMDNIAGVCNPQGNVVALMPHPERALFLRQVPSTWGGQWGAARRSLAHDSQAWEDPGPGYAIFLSMAKALHVRS